MSGPTGTASMGGNSTGATAASSFSFAGTAAPTQSGIAKPCTNYHLVQNGDSCNSIQDMYMNFTLSQFYSWNP